MHGVMIVIALKCWILYLWGQHKGLHELPHGLHVVGQLSHHLHYNPLIQSGMRIDMPNFGVAVIEAQSHHLFVDFLCRTKNNLESTTLREHRINGRWLKSSLHTYRLAVDSFYGFAIVVQTTMHIGRILAIKPVNVKNMAQLIINHFATTISYIQNSLISPGFLQKTTFFQDHLANRISKSILHQFYSHFL